MQEIVWRKLADVLALAHACINSLERGREVLETVLGKYKSKELVQDNVRTINQLTEIAQKTSVFALIGQHATSFEIKLDSLRDDYMRGEWQSVVKVLEVLGFLEGIACVQWNLLLGMAEQYDYKELLPCAQQGAHFHEQTLKLISEASKVYKAPPSS